MRTRFHKRLLAGMLSIMMVLNLGFMPAMADDAADSGAPRDSGTLQDSGALTITGFAPLAKEIRYQRTGADSLVLPKTLTATVDGKVAEVPATWDGLAEINKFTGGLYVFTANVGQYTVAPDVELPVITALVLGRARILGLGTAASPLQITSEIQLREVASLVNAGELEALVLGSTSAEQVYLRLMNNITLSGAWTPIGTAEHPFGGVFDAAKAGGGKYAVSGVRVNQANLSDVGLFGYTGQGSKIQNLDVTDVDIAGKNHVGGVAGTAGGTVSNCSATGKVSGVHAVGGVVGLAKSSDSDITGCSSSVEINGINNVGGVVGYANGAVKNSFATGDVIGTGGAVGGLAGSAGGNVTKSYATGSVSGENMVGGLVGAAGGAIVSSYAIGGVAGTGDNVGGVVGSTRGDVSNSYATGSVGSAGSNVGGIAGEAWGMVSSCTALNPRVSGNAAAGRVAGAFLGTLGRGSANTAFAGMLDANGNKYPPDTEENYTNGINIKDLATLDLRFIEKSVWTAFDGKATLPALVGVGQQTVTRPTHLVVSSAAKLFSGGDGTAASPYKISGEMDLRELANLVNGGNGFAGKFFELTADITVTGEWTPIGMGGNRFEGSFNGAGKTISGVTINKPESFGIGLFGDTENTSTIKNLGVIGANIKGGEYVGALVGASKGAITNCYATGSVSGTATHVGGLVGGNAGTITSCYSTASVSGTGLYTGGLVGASNGVIQNSYAAGSVRGEGGSVGGVVGGITGGGPLQNCTALNPSVVGAENTTGRVAGSIAPGATASGNAAFAGMKNSSGGRFGADDGTGENGKDIQNITTLDGRFDDATVWTAPTATTLPALVGVGRQTVARPLHLIATEHYAFGGGRGTEAEPYQIATEEHLRVLAKLVKGGDKQTGVFFEQTQNITLTGEWEPIGTGSSPFDGSFNGGGKTISGVYINQPKAASIGLFGFAGANSSLKNIHVREVDVKGNGSVGGLVGVSYGTVEGCSSIGAVSGAGGEIGGLAGKLTRGVTGSYAGGTVSGDGAVGGLVGYAVGNVISCYAASDVSGTGDMIGGVAGGIAGSVKNSYATGSVTGAGEKVGGVAGVAVGDVVNCVALNPQVSGKLAVGRVMGSGNGSGNYAFMGVYVQENGAEKPLNKGANTRDGADVRFADVKSDAWWTKAGFTSPWITANDNLPVLQAGAKFDLPIYLTETPGTALGIHGPAGMTLAPGYRATSTAAFTVTGVRPVRVEKISGDEKITWNAATKKLDIAAGLPVGTYPVELTASNITEAEFTYTFTLTVKQSSSGGGSSVSSWKPDVTADVPSANVDANGAVKSADVVKAAAEKITAAKAAGQKNPQANVLTENAASVSAATLQELAAAAKKAGGTARLLADTTEKGKVVGRIYLDTALAGGLKGDVLLGVTTNAAETGAVSGLFQKHFGARVAVVRLAHQGAFGMRVQIAVKADPMIDTAKPIYFYSYDRKTNTYVRLQNTAYTVDKNGWLYFYTTMGGDILYCNTLLK